MPRLPDDPPNDAIRLPTRYGVGVEYVPIYGPAGPAGEAGPAGAAGPAGTPADPAVTNALDARLTSTEAKTVAYVAVDFGGDEVQGERAFLKISHDGETFTPLGGTIAGIPRGRDFDLIDWAGRYFLMWTKGPAFGVVSTGFGLAVSDDLGVWTVLADVPFTAVAGVQRVWGPCPVKDGNTLRVYVAVSTVNSDNGPFTMYETHALNLALTSWSTPVNVSAGLPASVFDMNPGFDGGQWVALYKNNTTEFIERAVSSSPTGPWTVTDVGDWQGHAAALGTNPPAAEGVRRFRKSNGNTVEVFDRYRIPPSGDYRQARTYLSETSDPALRTGWSAPRISNTLGRHASVRSMSIPLTLLSSARAPHLELARLADYTAPTAYGVPVPWDFIDEDVDGMVDFSLSNLYGTIRNGGVYTSSLNYVYLSAAGGNRFGAIRFNEDYVPGVTDKRPGSSYDPAVSVSVTRRLRRGDRFDVVIQSDTAVNLGTVPPPRLRVTRVGS